MRKTGNSPYELVVSRKDGLFSNLYSVIGALDWCEKHARVAAVRFDSGPYLDPDRGPNWWEYYFERVSDIDPMSLTVLDRAVLRTRATEWSYSGILDRQTASRLIGSHIRIRQEVIEGLDEFWNANMANRFVVGMHLRGTDKFIEQVFLDTGEGFSYLDKLVYGRPPNSWRLFLATDDERLLAEARARFGDQLVCMDHLRSGSRQALHREFSRDEWARGPHRDEAFPAKPAHPPYRIGLEAIRDALLLSRCHVFIGSQSGLSYFVAHKNPSMPAIHIGGYLPIARDAFIAALQRMAAEGKTSPKSERSILQRCKALFRR